MRVLVVEDDPSLGRLIVRGLRSHHHAVDLAATVRDATEAAEATAYDIVCLDLGLPDGDGIELCRQLRASEHMHRPRRILVLTARDAVASRIEGLDAGADDYLTKPFDFDELVARLRALDRRRDEPGSTLTVGDLWIDAVSHRIGRASRDIHLTSREFAVLLYLARRADDVVSAETLIEHCWDANADPFTASLRVILSRLRRKLGDPPLIHTVAGAGYRLDSSQ